MNMLPHVFICFAFIEWVMCVVWTFSPPPHSFLAGTHGVPAHRGHRQARASCLHLLRRFCELVQTFSLPSLTVMLHTWCVHVGYAVLASPHGGITLVLRVTGYSVINNLSSDHF